MLCAKVFLLVLFFVHKEKNICGHLRAPVAAHTAARSTGRRFRDPETLIAFVTYGQIPLLSASETPRRETLDRVRHYIDLLLEAELQA